MVGVEEEGVREGEGGDSGGQTDEEGVDIGDQDDGAFVCDGVLVGDGGEGSPLLKVEGLVGVGDEAVALGVGAGTHDDPAEHGVAAVPDLCLYGWPPAVFFEGGVFIAPVLYGIVEHRAGDRCGGRSGNNPVCGWGEGGGRANKGEDRERLERRHGCLVISRVKVQKQRRGCADVLGFSST